MGERSGKCKPNDERQIRGRLLVSYESRKDRKTQIGFDLACSPQNAVRTIIELHHDTARFYELAAAILGSDIELDAEVTISTTGGLESRYSRWDDRRRVYAANVGSKDGNNSRIRYSCLGISRLRGGSSDPLFG